MNVFRIIGFGGQGQAWARVLKNAGYTTIVYQRTPSDTHHRSLDLLQNDLTQNDFILMACPDSLHGEIYRTYLKYSALSLNIILLHGYSMWAKELKTESHHPVCLMAPKAIGEELKNTILESQKSKFHHTLKLGWNVDQLPESAATTLFNLLNDHLYFKKDHLIPCSFEQEATGDLISEQLLLCGGLFTLFEITEAEMRRAGVPEDLIQEECLTELELVVRVLRKFGLEETKKRISENARIGATLMRKDFINAGLQKVMQERTNRILDQRFLKELKQERTKDHEQSSLI